MDFRIYVDQPWARLDPPVTDLLEQYFALPDPEAEHSELFQDGRWDGKRRLYRKHDAKFPAGLVYALEAGLCEQGHRVELIYTNPRQAIDLSRLTSSYIPSKPFRPYQLEALQVALAEGSGVLKMATGAGKTLIIAALARYIWEETGLPVLVIVPRVGLAVQTLHELHQMYGDDLKLGLLKQGSRETGAITIATDDTMAAAMVRNVKKVVNGRRMTVAKPADEIVAAVLREAGVIIIDETHHSSSVTIQNISEHSRARWRYGFSGTPLKDSVLDDARVIGSCGPIIYDVPAVDLIAQGYLSRPLIAAVCAHEASGPPLGNKMQYKHAYKFGIVQNEHHNIAVLRAVEWILGRDRQVLILCRHKEQWLRLHAGLEEMGVPFAAVWGATATHARTTAKRAFGEGSVKVLLGSEVLGEGEDIKNVEAVVLAEGVKVNTNVIQRLGRGMRLKPQCGNLVWVVDFIPRNHRRMFDHGYARVEHYEAEGHEVRVVERWPKKQDENPWPDLLPFATWG